MFAPPARAASQGVKTFLRTAALLGSVLAPLGAVQALTEGEAARPCLNYWQRGDASRCPDPWAQPARKPRTPRPVTPTVVAAPVQSSPTTKTLDDRIDKFLADYGKPPREFVAFYLEPTPENAMKWVHTYQEILNRPQQLAYVWTQAESMYADALKQGVPMAKLSSSTLSPVRDFGIPVSGFSSPIPTSDLAAQNALMNQFAINNKALAAKDVGGASSTQVLPRSIGGRRDPQPALGAFAADTFLLGAVGGAEGTAVSGLATAGFSSSASAPQGPFALDNSLGGLSGGLTMNTAAAGPSAATPAAPAAGIQTGPMELTYYFSAVCPYCQRFTPELHNVMTNLGARAKLTCVDITPYMGPRPEGGVVGPQQGNIAGQLDCAWRAAELGEEERLGISKTPTLLVRRGPGQPEERVNGLVSQEQLSSYLLRTP